jgi:hypothetical protein
MIEDESTKVRIACLNNIPVDEVTVGYFLTKTLDQASEVRVAVYKHLKKEWSKSNFVLGNLKVIPQFGLPLIENGLSDSVEAVALASVEFLKEWLIKDPNTSNNLIDLS